MNSNVHENVFVSELTLELPYCSQTFSAYSYSYFPRSELCFCTASTLLTAYLTFYQMNCYLIFELIAWRHCHKSLPDRIALIQAVVSVNNIGHIKKGNCRNQSSSTFKP